MIKKQIILTVILVAALLLTAGIFWYVDSLKSNDANLQKIVNNSGLNKEDEENINLEDKNSQEIVWLKYQNEDLGIEFEYPAKAFSYDHFGDGNYDKCESESGRKEISVPYKIFADDSNIFIKEEYYYEIDDNNCQKIFNTIDALRSKPTGKNLLAWHIKLIEIKNKKELSDYIVSNFGWGGGCSLGEIKESGQEGIFDVEIAQDGTDLGNTTCGVNYKYYLKYIPTKNKLIRWNTGQECIIGKTFNDCFDKKIVKSMKFN